MPLLALVSWVEDSRSGTKILFHQSCCEIRFRLMLHTLDTSRSFPTRPERTIYLFKLISFCLRLAPLSWRCRL